MIIQDYQGQKRIEEVKATDQNFATVAAVYSDGISLLFDGATEPSRKRYKANRSILFAAGDRVKITKVSGTYIVEYPVGNPKMT